MGKKACYSSFTYSTYVLNCRWPKIEYNSSEVTAVKGFGNLSNKIALWVNILWLSIKRIIPIIDPAYAVWASKQNLVMSLVYSRRLKSTGVDFFNMLFTEGYEEDFFNQLVLHFLLCQHCAKAGKTLSKWENIHVRLAIISPFFQSFFQQKVLILIFRDRTESVLVQCFWN